MRRPKFSFVLFVLCWATVAHSAIIFPGNVHVEEGEGFMVWLTSEKDIEKCEIDFNTSKWNTSEPISTEFGTIERIVSSDPKECGFRIKGATLQSEGLWKIVYYIDGVSNRNSVEVRVATKTPVNKCPERNSDHLCTMIHSKTKEETTCKDFDYAAVNASEWTCKYFTTGSMVGKVDLGKGRMPIQEEEDAESSDRLLELEYTGAPEFTETVDVGEIGVLLNCSNEEHRHMIDSCEAKHVSSGRRFNLEPGLQSRDRKYSSYKTSLLTGRCQFELAKPISLEDIGIWEISMKGKKCSFIVHPKIDETVEVKTMGDKEVQITCAKNLNYPLTSCYMQSLSTGSVIQFKKSRELRDGVCEFVRPAESKDWYCGYNRPEDTDVIIKYSLKSYNNSLINENVQWLNKWGFAEVHEINGAAIKHCLIMEPEGRMFSLSTEQLHDSQQKYAPFGIGLEKGQCGIRFSDSAPLPGPWTFNVEMQDGRVHNLQFIFAEKEATDGM